MRRNPTLCLPVLAAWLVATASHAQVDEIVVSAKRIDQTATDVAGTVARIDADALARTGHTHINEAMQRVAGAWISRGNGQEHLTAVRSPVLTGAGGCGGFFMAQDGIAVRASGFCNVNELFESTSELAGGIEVVKGPAGAFYGSNALHGVVNVLSKAIDAPGAIGLELGPHGYGRVRLGAQSDGWRVDASGTTDDGYKRSSGLGQHKLSARWNRDLFGADVTTTFTLTNLNQETAGFVAGVDAYENQRLKRVNPNPEAFRDSRSMRLYSRIAMSPDAGGQLILTPYIRHTEMDFLQHFLPGQALEENGHTSVGFQSAWHGESVGLRVSLGIDAERTDGFLKETQAGPTASPSAFLRTTIPQGKHYDYEVEAGMLAVFAHAEYDLGPSTTLVAGLRGEHVDYDYDNRMRVGRTQDNGIPCGFGGCRFNRPADREDKFGNLSPSIGIIRRLSDTSNVYVNLARGFRAPQTTELYRLQNAQSVSRIDSESMLSLEVGYRQFTVAGRLDLAAYTMRKDNVIFRDSNRINVDDGETSHKGIEVSLNRELAPSLEVSLAATYQRHEYDAGVLVSGQDVSGNDIDTAPRFMGSMQLVWRPTSRISTELEWIRLARYYTDASNANDYPGHTLINLRAEFAAGDWRLFARIMNAADRDYAERADFGFGSERYFVGEPRSLYVGLQRHL
ncbi:MAG: TonB-dependent receptor [Gammaproteobacteria bacterium]|nr:TonB-dependent receptor [Gammaproteobacteria bacterium]